MSVVDFVFWLLRKCGNGKNNGNLNRVFLCCFHLGGNGNSA